MKLRLIFLVAATATLAAACTKRDDTLVAPAASASAQAEAPAATAAPSASANLTMSPATGEMKDRSWAGQVNEAKATASATANAAQERAEKADAAGK